MLTAYALIDGRLNRLETPAALDQAAWIDLYGPTAEEAAAVAALAGIDVPSEADLQVLSDTDRLYRERGNTYLEFTVLYRSAEGHPETTDLSAILAGPRLITVRYADPTPIARFANAYARKPCAAPSAMGIFVGMLESFVARIGEYVEGNSSELYAISRQVFTQRKEGPLDTPQLQDLLDRLGRSGDFNAKARDSLASIGRLLAYVREESEESAEKATLAVLRGIRRDVAAISDYANFVAGQLSFVLNAVLGLVTVEQNRIIKIFSVVATLFIPPTLFASLWGMNFTHMPELEWTFGYPLALLTIVISAIVPYLFFKWRRWL